MTRWDWTWEERTQANRSPTVEPPPGAEQDGHETYAESEHRAQTPPDPGRDPDTVAREERDRIFRRRRAGAGLALVAILVLLVGAFASRGGSGHAKTPSTAHPISKLRPSPTERAAALAEAEQNAIDSVLSYTPAIRSGGSNGKEVALTFDDGPGPYTEQLVSTLNQLHVRATFFAIGSQEQYFSAGTLAEIDAGDVIGDHTETHPMMASLSPHDQHEQLFDQMGQIELVGGPRPRLFRPPYGSFDSTTFRELHHLHLLMVLWSVDTADYTLPGVSTIVQNALAGAKPGAIILMHDGGGNRSETIAALPAIVKGLRKRGLRPVTVPRLLLDDPPPRGLPLPTNLSGD